MTLSVAPPVLEWYSLDNAADYLHRMTGLNWNASEVIAHAQQKAWPVFAKLPDKLSFIDDRGSQPVVSVDSFFRLTNDTVKALSLHRIANVSRVILPIDGADDITLDVVHPAPEPTRVALADVFIRGEILTTHVAPAKQDQEPPISTVHQIRSRTDVLTAVIDRAVREADDPDSNPAVWASFVRICEGDSLPGTISGIVPGKGIRYRDADTEPRILSKKAFYDRLDRRRKKEEPPR